MEIKQLVEKKVDKIITKDLQLKIIDENTPFDVESYVNNLFDVYFDDINFLETDFAFFDSENSTDDQNSLQDSFEFESNEFNNFSTEELLLNLVNNSKEIRKKSIRALEIHAEDLILQSSWGKIEDILEKYLTHSNDAEIQGLVLKVFQKLLKFSNKIQILTKAFTSTAQIFINAINLFNIDGNSKNFKTNQSELLLKLMWLLMNSQQQIKSMGFNETNYNEIIYTFINLLNITTSENAKLTSLELLSVLNPKATWCKFWCHSATGRSLICSALRKYKNLFIYITEVVLKYIDNKKNYKLPPLPDKVINSKWSNISNREDTNELVSVKNTNKNSVLKNSQWIIKTIPKELIQEAVFFHCLNFITYLIQFRNGRALFPIQTTMKKRLLNVQDFSEIVINFIENIDWKINKFYTINYQTNINKILETLQNVKIHVTSSRMSAEKTNFYI